MEVFWQSLLIAAIPVTITVFGTWISKKTERQWKLMDEQNEERKNGYKHIFDTLNETNAGLVETTKEISALQQELLSRQNSIVEQVNHNISVLKKVDKWSETVDDNLSYIRDMQDSHSKELKEFREWSDELDKENMTLREGVMSELQSSLIEEFNVLKTKETITQDELEHWNTVYGAYRALNGNGLCVKMDKRVQAMTLK